MEVVSVVVADVEEPDELVAFVIAERRWLKVRDAYYLCCKSLVGLLVEVHFLDFAIVGRAQDVREKYVVPAADVWGIGDGSAERREWPFRRSAEELDMARSALEVVRYI